MKNNLEKFTPFIFISAGFSALFCLVAGLMNTKFLLATVPLSVAFNVALYLQIRLLGKRAFDIVDCIQNGMATGDLGPAGDFPVPLCVVDNAGEIVWYNNLFGDIFEEEPFGAQADRILLGYVAGGTLNQLGVEVSAGGRNFVCYCAKDRKKDSDLNILYLFENTKLRQIATEYQLSRPVVLSLLVDNYEDVLGNFRDSEKARISGQVEQILEEYISATTGVLIRLDGKKFLAIVEQRHLSAMMADRFKVLDSIRHILGDSKSPITLSIGVGMTEPTIGENLQTSSHALDMALGRGGDQAAVKTDNGYDFFGGVSKGVEKRTKVKARVIASSIRELINMSNKVLIMGHRFSDLDAMGSSAAMCRCIAQLGKECYCVLDEKSTLAMPIVEKIKAEGFGDMFISPADAERLADKLTLVMVMDTHTADMVDAPAILSCCQNKVIIDHHRRRVDYIEGATVFYHEPYVSSTSEMVTELLGYLNRQKSIEPVFADGLLSGIALDTKNFAVKTGVRTFEAAAALRQLGADTVEVKKMFSSTMQSFINRTRVVSEATIYNGCAISAIGDPMEDMRVVAAQAADELLEISKVQASFVLFKIGSGVNISARSMGDMNVQLVLEALGGGGHHTMAGAQLNEISLLDATELVKSAIDQYTQNNKE